MFDYSVVIGRFQPLHVGHERLIDHALKISKTVILLVGSANQARSVRNPFSFEERKSMIERVYSRETRMDRRILIFGIEDFVYSNDAWVARAQSIVNETILTHGNKGGVVLHGLNDFKVVLVGLEKDISTTYLRWFPQWYRACPDDALLAFSATDIRNDYFRRVSHLPHGLCSDMTVQFLSRFMLSRDHLRLIEEAEYLERYKASWASAPFPPVFVTVDAIAVQRGHLLLVERKHAPGRGLLALPGGFVDVNETLRRSVVRELREETEISDEKGPIPPAMLDSFIDDAETRVFDAPERSQRGRVITHAFVFRFPDRSELFSVKGADDAEHADWYQLGNLKPHQFFEDHWSILQEVLGVTP